MWPIEENAKIVRICVWLRPPNPPISAERALERNKNFELNEDINWQISAVGAIFCHVKRISKLDQVKEAVTFGTQWWKGASPILILRLKMRIKFVIII